jgi:hypothetical protein
MKKHTPWGTTQSAKELAPGIISYVTASHGGIWLDAAHRKALNYHKSWLGTDEWWEEDVDWAVPYVAFRNEIQAQGQAYKFNKNLSAAWRTIEMSHPEFYARFKV